MAHPQEPIRPDAAAKFAAFIHGWVDHHQALLDHILPLLSSDHASREAQLVTDAIGLFLLHYQNYFDEVSNLASEDVSLVFSAPWLSPFERTFLWNGGFRPTLVFRFIDTGDLTEEQSRCVEEVKAETRRKERELGEAMAVVQERVAAPPLLGLMRLRGKGPAVLDGEEPGLASAVEELKAAMRGVLEGSDGLRGKTVRRLMEVLRPDQAVRFFAAAANFQLRVRRWGLQRDRHFG